MKLRRHVIWMVLAVAVLESVESSILLSRSLLKPRLPEPCFTCRAEDRPYSYTLISHFNTIKDMFVRALNTLVEKTKEYQLEQMSLVDNEN